MKACNLKLSGIMSQKHEKIPADLMEDFVKRRISSAKLAELTGYHPVYLRRSIKREPLPPKKIPIKSKFIEARERFRSEIAHLPPAEIAKIAAVSLSTAARIKKKYGKTNVR